MGVPSADAGLAEGVIRQAEMEDPIGANVFIGSSQMAELMRSVDWGATTLGPVEQWPQSCG